jgi:hypothetical protein
MAKTAIILAMSGWNHSVVIPDHPNWIQEKWLPEVLKSLKIYGLKG